MKPTAVVATVLACTAAALLAGCGREAEREPAPDVRTVLAYGPYRAALTVPGGELPFGLELAREGEATVAYLVNGPERVRVTDVTQDGTRLDLVMPGYQNRIVAEATPEGLAGEVRIVRRGGEVTRIPFKATAGRTHRFSPTPPTPAGSVAGRWTVTLTSANGRTEPAVAEFTQDGATVTGTFLTPTGDHRYLAGELRGDELLLSRFDGGSAFLYRAKLAAPDAIEGRLWSGTWSERTWTARRDDAARLPDGASATKLKNPEEPLAFAFPDVDGKLVSLDDPRFAGKVVLVTIGGSWCPNCHDEAEFLQPYWRELRDDGLEIVALQFEHSADRTEAVAANRRYVAKFGIEWPVLIAGTTEENGVLASLPQLANFVAYPTMLFVDREGRVRKIHTGFSGPATGRHHEEWKVEFERTVQALLAEKA
ncbi:MAG: TlpA disulfide reductase family protein [Steroidobacteraceae bacterium]|nr:TlpA disulfide reductase family protein [Steroidobacteraceae bacterium]